MTKEKRANSMASAVEELSKLVAKYEGRVYAPPVQLINAKFRSRLNKPARKQGRNIRRDRFALAYAQACAELTSDHTEFTERGI